MTDADASIARFRARLDAARPPTGGVPTEVVEREVLPVLPLLVELPIDDRTGDDFDSFRFREALTVLTLVGRRLALLDLTPTSALAVVEAVLHSVKRDGEPSTDAFDQHARVAALEGFVRGREERVEVDGQLRAETPVRPLRMDANTFGLLVSGVHEPEVLGEFVDALGRVMLDADASVGIVDFSQLGEPNRDRARALFAADEVVRMLGGQCVFCGIDSRWRAAAEDAHVDLTRLHVVGELAQALEKASAIDAEPDDARKSPLRSLLLRLRR